ncbi:MAG: hypothetical protein ACFFCS_24615 [Candidatus Hodarchaeota archaeon]
MLTSIDTISTSVQDIFASGGAFEGMTYVSSRIGSAINILEREIQEEKIEIKRIRKLEQTYSTFETIELRKFRVKVLGSELNRLKNFLARPAL